MLNPLNKGISTSTGIITIFVVAVLLIGGILAWQYWDWGVKEELPKEVPEKVPEEVPGRIIQPQEYVVVTKENSKFHKLAEYFAENKKAKLITFKRNFDEIIPELGGLSPKYLAIVLEPKELTPDFIDNVDEKLRIIDNDPFFDVAYGIITSFTIEDGYNYVNKLLNYKTPSNFSIYGINQDYIIRRLRDWYGLNLFDRCLEGYGISVCNDELRATVDRISKEAKNYEILNFGLHGTPSSMDLARGESLKGSINGLIGEKITDEEECHEERSGGLRIKVCGPKIEKVPISLNAALVTAFSCTTARINGKPSIIHKEYDDSETEGNIETSLVLSFLKSGALNYIGATHVAETSILPTEAIATETILQGKPIGLALKNFKNSYIFNKMFESKTLEGKPKASDFTIGFIEFQLRNWVLFGDPSISITKEKIKPENCIRSYKESISTRKIDGRDYKFKEIEARIAFEVEGKYDLKNTILVSEAPKNGGVVSFGNSCAINIPLETRLIDFNITGKGYQNRFDTYFTNKSFVENLGDELIVVVPWYILEGGSSGSLDLKLSIQMEL